ncbi:GDSL-like Lipase/Acylhydrolase family protein [Pseudobutyrivibrio sp. YE44]|uniref:SGNH/GDSL hydrolase family protein n=1 Tax=Pseudobutyrivibrio sp. YE44 TaxID=1520802 RepID=UPI0008851BD4|nr:SGNH/GDSL hydrolase family protein [Pseudobutyrivibrio sp. YE44]SDB35122.1 GDSL-like Lipase/Acylhydrolase family protein [Pseudobutyrivibrio sp. YE44]
MEMQIAKAPTDPEKNRPYFYIIKDKEIFTQSDEEGKGVSFLYQSDGRLISSATFTGNVTDEHILKLMETVDGFKELVHSVGVSVEMDDKDKQAEFVFQMYGKEDLYGGGANLICDVSTNSQEERIYMKDIDWTEDDDVPGQIRIHTDAPEQKAFLSVRFFLNDGFEAPPQLEEKPVDTNSKEYKEMIDRSLVNLGNTKRLMDVVSKAKAGEEVHISYIGGSITQGAGATPINTECYAYKSFLGFKKLMGDGDNIHYHKAGVGGTPSELGMLRFDRDVLEDGAVTPDIVVIEFAVNDEGDETKGNCYESLVRRALKLPNNPAVLLMFSVFADDYNLQDRLAPVGFRYDLPMASVKDAVTPQFYDRDNRILTKHQYFYDMFHPTNLGHTIMADTLINIMKLAIEKGADESYDPRFEDAPAIGNTFDDVILVDKKDNINLVQIKEGGFVYTDDVLQSVERDMDLHLTPQLPNNWMYDGGKGSTEPFEMDVECKALVLVMKDSGEVDAATAKVYVDDKFVRDLDPYVNRWCHCNPLIVIDETVTAKHHVKVVVDPDVVRNKFTILGFGLVR